MPRLFPPWPLREIHLAQVVRHDQALDWGVLAIELVRSGDLRRSPVALLAGQNARKVVVAHVSFLSPGRLWLRPTAYGVMD